MDIIVKSYNNNRAMMLRIIHYHLNHRRVRHEPTAFITIVIIIIIIIIIITIDIVMMLLRRIPEPAFQVIRDPPPPRIIPDLITVVRFPIRHQCHLECIAPDFT
jgi:hypothetical protein